MRACTYSMYKCSGKTHSRALLTISRIAFQKKKNHNLSIDPLFPKFSNLSTSRYYLTEKFKKKNLKKKKEMEKLVDCSYKTFKVDNLEAIESPPLLIKFQHKVRYAYACSHSKPSWLIHVGV